MPTDETLWPAGKIISYIKSDLSLVTFANGNDYLQDLDLSLWNVRFLNIRSDDFKQFIKSISRNHASFAFNYQPFADSLHLNPIHAAVPTNHGFIDRNALKNIRDALIVLVPSLFKPLKTYNFGVDGQPNESFFNLVAIEYHETQSEVWSHKPIQFEKHEAGIISSFIRLYLDKQDKEYLDLTIRYYLNCYLQTEDVTRLLNLCIGLEALIEGSTEIMYKIQRCAAVINSQSVESGWTIFRNIKHIYELRSQIVHGENFNAKYLADYRDYLINLVSRTIVELLQSKICSKKELNKRVNESGFGRRNEVLSSMTNIVVNKYAYERIQHTLEKYKAKKS